MSDISVLSIVLLVVLVVTLVRIGWLIWRIPTIHEHLRRHTKVLAVLHVAHVRRLHAHIHVRWHLSRVSLHWSSPLLHHIWGSYVMHELLGRRRSTLVRHEAILWWHTIAMHSSVNWILIPIRWHLVASWTLCVYVMVHRHWRFLLHLILLLISCLLVLIVNLCYDFFEESLQFVLFTARSIKLMDYWQEL